MGKDFLSLRFALTGLLTLGLLIIGGWNIREKRIYVSSDDGCTWVQTGSGVQARVVTKEGPCDRAGIREGDFLTAINDRPIENESDVPTILFAMGPYSNPTYTIVRNGIESFSTPIYVESISPRLIRQRLYLEIIGIYFFAAGAFVLIKRFRSAHSQHF